MSPRQWPAGLLTLLILALTGVPGVAGDDLTALRARLLT